MEDGSEQRADELFAEGKERARRGGGGKLSRSETVTVRLDPKLNYLCELAARAQRRTKSSFIEWAIDNALKYVPIPANTNAETIASQSEALWDVEEADRLAQLAFVAPVLMTHEEQLVWKLVENNGLLWRGSYVRGKWCWGVGMSHFRWDTFREHYLTFKDVAEGYKPKSDLPKWQVDEERPFDVDLDSDVPF